MTADDWTEVVTELVPNVLAARYASLPLARLWSPEQKIVLERRLWLAVLRAQQELGVDVPSGAIEAYEAVVEKVDLASIDARERVTRHDVKARIEEFSALGFIAINCTLGTTSSSRSPANPPNTRE